MLAATLLAVVLAAGPQLELGNGSGAARAVEIPDGRALRPPAPAGEASAGSRSWSSADVALQAAFVVAMAADWNQTRNTIAAQREIPGRPGWHYYERNPILGRAPSRTKVDAYFLCTTAAHLSIAHLIPHGRWRTAWQLVGIGVEVGTVGRNLKMGIGFRF